MERVLERHPVVDQERAQLQHRSDDLPAARGAKRITVALRRLAYHRAIVTEAALARRERVGPSGLGVKPHDAVVEQYPGRRRDDARAEDGEERLRYRAEIALAVDDAEVRRAAIPVAGRLEALAPMPRKRARKVGVARLRYRLQIAQAGDDHRPAGHAGRGEHAAAVVADLDRLGPLRAIVGEVLEREATPLGPHIGDKGSADLAAIEGRCALAADGFQRVRDRKSVV